jgi:hypothetical protein
MPSKARAKLSAKADLAISCALPAGKRARIQI